ncbi:hypothetical protein D6833_04120 [Candidatus Parcubacteria bacterium]|nr:MAG: hypothetical protein D6833_04120 [Candidatus Parcubacteria bacterium]
MAKVIVRPNEERLNRCVTVDQMIAMQEGQFRAIRDVLAYFVVDESGRYVEDYEEAKRILGRLTIGELYELSEEFVGASEDIAVPPENAVG